MKQRHLLIFDFDGTIADTAAIVIEVGNEVLREYGLKTVDHKDFEKMRSKTATELLREFKIPLYRVPAIVSSVRHALKERMDVLQPVEGMIPLIKELSEREDTEVAVLSSNSLENVTYFLNKYKFRQYFSFIYGDVGVFSKYTKIRRISRSEGKGAHVISIGDEVRDHEAARIAKVESISVDWGMSSKDRLEAVGAQHVVSSVAQLKSCLDERMKNE